MTTHVSFIPGIVFSALIAFNSFQILSFSKNRPNSKFCGLKRFLRIHRNETIRTARAIWEFSRHDRTTMPRAIEELSGLQITRATKDVSLQRKTIEMESLEALSLQKLTKMRPTKEYSLPARATTKSRLTRAHSAQAVLPPTALLPSHSPSTFQTPRLPGEATTRMPKSQRSIRIRLRTKRTRKRQRRRPKTTPEKTILILLLPPLLSPAPPLPFSAPPLLSVRRFGIARGRNRVPTIIIRESRSISIWTESRLAAEP